MRKLLKRLPKTVATNKQLMIGIGIGLLLFAIPFTVIGIKHVMSRSNTPSGSSSVKQAGTLKETEKSGAETLAKTQAANSSTQQNTSKTTVQKPSTAAAASSNSSASATPAPALPPAQPTTIVTPAQRINGWTVYIYQDNLGSSGCGTTSANPCKFLKGIILSLVAVNDDTGAAIPLKDCSMTAGPVGFSIPGGSFSANPSVYMDGGVPVCGGGYDFPVAGHYKLNYEIWLADGLNVDMPYRGGLIMDYYVAN